MTFLLPLGLLSLLALPVILILHLIQQRRRIAHVPSIELWTMAQAPLQQQRRKLPLTWLLLFNLLVAAILAIALGRPFLPAIRLDPTTTVVVLDTSTSMATTDVASNSHTRFAAAQSAAHTIFAGAREGDQIGLVVMGTPPVLVGRGGPEAATVLGDAVDAQRPAGPDGDLGAALSLASSVAAPTGDIRQPQIVVLTDQSFVRPAPTLPLTVTGDLQWRTFGSATDNVAIVALAARPLRSGSQQLYARVANLGDSPAVRSLAVVVDGVTVQTEPVRLEADTEAEWSWPLPRGAQSVEARLSPNDLAPLDDQADTLLTTSTQMHVQLVSAAATPLERALKAQPGLDVVSTTPADYHPDPQAGLVVFVGFVPAQLPAAPTLLVAPASNNSVVRITGVRRDLRANIESATDPLHRAFSTIDFQSILFARVSTLEVPPWATSFLNSGDIPLVLAGIYQRYPRAIWTFDPATNALDSHLAFPLLTAATLRTLVPQTSTALIVGDTAPEPLNAPDGTRLATGAILATPGIYRWVGRSGTVAVNALNAAEADVRRHAPPAIDVLPPTTTSVAQDAGRQLWRILLGIAAILLALEWLIVRRGVRPRRPPPAPRVSPSRRQQGAA